MQLEDEMFRRLYSSLGFMTQEGECYPLDEVCSNRETCWVHSAERKPDSWSKISRPWAGPKYKVSRFLVVGDNFNEYGGYEAMQGLFEAGRDEILKGYRRIRFRNLWKTYRGTTLWHRLGCYGIIFAEAAGLAQASWDEDGFPQKEDVVHGFDFIVFSNHVKCSPRRQRSKPTNAMWENCGKHVLRKEMELLQPKDILILGYDNFDLFMRNLVETSNPGIKKQEGLAHWEQISGHSQGIRRVFAVPHPAQGQGAKVEVLQHLRQVLENVRMSLRSA